MGSKSKLVLAIVLVSCAVANGVNHSGAFENSQKMFSVNIFKNFVKSQQGNLIMSPLSAQLVLALTGEGAKGETHSEMARGLQLQENSADRHNIILSIVNSLNQSMEDLKVLSANKIFVAEGFTIEKSFTDVAVDVYQSGVQSVDFSASVDTANIVNQWVEDRTNHRIKNLLSPDQLDEDTKLVLVNALYFSGEWLVPFEPSLTSPRPFHSSKTVSKPVEMMNNKFETKYAYDNKLKAKFLKLAFENTSISMTFILPDEIEGLAAVEENMVDYINKDDFKHIKVDVTIPKFTIETTINFKPLLEKIGIKKLFTPGQADLTGISSNVGLFVNHVVQKAFINVTETGAEAAAATAVVVVLDSAIIDLSPSPAAVFRADHPFIYLLKDDHSDIIMFAGKYCVV